MIKLTLIHNGFNSDMDTFESVGGGWPLIVYRLKSLLETREPLVYPSSN